ncbi:MAG: DUF4299 domain-containing protein [Lachnospiraceae bacterium]|nr:DUF4299 domain-containing protein [Lachnospiraceae bacterium]
MAFTLQIKQKKLLGKTTLDLPSLADACGLCYGSNNDFYILQEGEQERGTAILYNPNRIGRGIFYNGAKAGEGYYEVSYNIPTTRAEIADFARLVGEMERRLGKVEMYCVEEERTFTSGELEQGIEQFAAFSLKSLNQFCGNKDYQNYILTLARWPYTMTEDKVAAWATCTNLSDFEQTIHNLQSMDVYYAKPRLLQRSDTNEIGAFYALTEECESVFPVRADGFLNLGDIKIAEGFVQFVLYSEQRVMDGLFSYERFIEELQGWEIRQFDADHILIPPMSKNDLEMLAEKLGGDF